MPGNRPYAGRTRRNDSTLQVLAPEEEAAQKRKLARELLLGEDCVETTLYYLYAPPCCSRMERFHNMLGMLGANIYDDSIYHRPEEHPHTQTTGGMFL